MSKNLENSIGCNKDYGLIFGYGGDLIIYNRFLSSNFNNMWSQQKTYFDKRYEINNGNKNFEINELEVYLINI